MGTSPQPACPAGGFDAWMREARPRLVSLARRLLWHEHDAEEIAQEALMLAWKNAATLRDIRHLDTWVYRTTLNLCHSRARRRRRWPQVLEVEPLADNDPEDAQTVTELTDRLRIAMKELPEKLRVALVLRDVEGLNYEQMAAITRVRPAALRLHVHRARERMRVILLKRWPDSFEAQR